MTYILKKNSEGDVLENMSILAGIRENFAQIQSNIYQISSCMEIRRACDFYMNVFRESFADLYAVITLYLSKEDYFNALETFLRKENGNGSDYHECLPLLVRAAFVVNAMNEEYTGTEKDEKLLGQWRNNDVHEDGGLLYEVEQFRKNMFLQKSEQTKEDALDRKIYSQEVSIPVILNNKMIEQYHKYFISCCEGYLRFRKEHDEKLSRLDDNFLVGTDITAFTVYFGWTESGAELG